MCASWTKLFLEAFLHACGRASPSLRAVVDGPGLCIREAFLVLQSTSISDTLPEEIDPRSSHWLFCTVGALPCASPTSPAMVADSIPLPGGESPDLTSDSSIGLI